MIVNSAGLDSTAVISVVAGHTYSYSVQPITAYDLNPWGEERTVLAEWYV